MKVVIEQYPVVNYYYEGTPWKQPSRGELRRALFEEHKNCYWCGVEMVLEVPPPPESLPDNTATIDHLIALPHRGKGAVVPKVLACNKCNIQRSIPQNPNHRSFKR